MLAMIDVSKVDAGVTDEADTTTVWSRYACVSNLAIFINGTNIVHDRWNNITTVVPTNAGKGIFDDSTTISNCPPSFTYNNKGCCVDDGPRFM
jgi:hypothetical protein